MAQRSDIEWVTVKRKIADLKEFDRNPRQINKDDFNKLVNGLLEDGYYGGIKINTDNTIIGGHQRKKALLKAGYSKNDEIEVLIPNRLLEGDDFDRINVRDNLIYGVWDTDILANSWDADKLLQWGLPESVLGVEVEEIEAEEGDNEVPEAPIEPTTRLGDVWVLGSHRLMCGDSTSPTDVDRLMMGQKAQMVFTDPPYNMDFTGGIHADGSKSFNAKHGKIANDKMSPEEAMSFFDGVNMIIKERCIGAFYICFYRLGIGDYWASLGRSGLDVRALIIWNKGNHTLSNSDYMSMYEPIFYGWVKEHDFYGGNNGRDIWEIKRTQKNDLHPTMKPVDLVLKAITESSKKGDIVLDLFGGSGSTLVGCERAGRISYCMELDPKYCDVIVARWEKLTGQKAELCKEQ